MLKETLRKKLIIICLITVACTTLVNAAGDVPLREKYTYGSGGTGEEYSRWMDYTYYSSFVDEYKLKGYKGVDGSGVVVSAAKTKVSAQSSLNLKNGIGGKSGSVYLWEENDTWAEWEFNVTAEGLYELEVEYYMLPGSGNDAVRSLKVDGEIPFAEANNIVFNRMWKDAGEPIINSLGDEARPGQEEVLGWRKISLTDSSGFYSSPFQFYLEPGKHTIRMEFIDQTMAISKVALVSASELITYKQLSEQYLKEGYKNSGSTVEFQAETVAIEKSDPTIRRESDGDPAVQPVSYINRKLNVIGGFRWRRGNQSITWKITVPEDGLYKIAFRVKQSWNDGLPSYRQISIDGKVPFKEFESYRFVYDRDWRTEVIKDDEGEPYLIYLEKGDHTFTMTVKMGDLTQVIHSLNDDIILLSDMLRNIIKVTGSNPDPNYDYELFKVIPALKSNMQALMDSLQKKYDLLENISGKLPAMANNFLTIKSQLKDMINDPFTIARKMNDLNSAQTSLGAWYLSMQNQPLLVDYIKVGAPEEPWKNERSGVFQKIRFTIANFLASFKKDYDNIGGILKDNTEVKASIDVWIARGTEWAELIKELADEEFTPQTGTMVNINVLPAAQLASGHINALMLSVTSGRAPDVGMGVDATLPVEFAIRDAAVDLSKFDSYPEVEKRFLKNIIIPYQYGGGTYALPETMDFQVLFYRKDIVEELGIMIPETWDELYSFVLPALYQNGLQFALSNSGTSTHYQQEFAQFLFQHGGEFYTEDGLKTALNSGEAFLALKEYTDLYTSYGIPVSAELFNRMRSGEVPMGIGDYRIYMQLSVAAPELTGRWGIAPIPGTKMPDGTINRSCGGLARQSNIILNQSEHQQEAWEFLEWWSSTAVQTKFAHELEALIGVEARWNSANVEAFSNLDWKKDDLKVIQEQWKWAKEIPVVLGGYFTSRHVQNAWNRVVIGGQNVKDALEEAVKDINRELRMKQEEFGVFRDEK